MSDNLYVYDYCDKCDDEEVGCILCNPAWPEPETE